MAKLADYELEQLYIDFIDETTPTITIWGMEYSASRVLQEIDPIAYRVGFSDWASNEECEDCEECLIDCKCEAE
jgi:hypothetical protein